MLTPASQDFACRRPEGDFRLFQTFARIDLRMLVLTRIFAHLTTGIGRLI